MAFRASRRPITMSEAGDEELPPCTWETKNEEGEWGEGVTEEGYPVGVGVTAVGSPVGVVRRARRGRNWRSPFRFPAVVPILTSSLPPPARRAV